MRVLIRTGTNYTTVAVRRAERCPDNAHTGRLEQVSNRTAPLLIAVANQETLLLEHAVCRIGELACDLQQERLVRVRRRSDNVDAPEVQFNHKHGVIRPLPGDELPVPAENRVRCDDRSHLRQNPTSKTAADNSQASSVIVR